VTTLIFPCCVPEGLAYGEEAQARGEAVVAASSLAYDATAPLFPIWLRLPSVYEPEFAAALRAVIAAHGITRVFAPVSGAHWVLQRMIREGELDLTLLGELPVTQHAREHEQLMGRAAMAQALVAQISAERSPLTRVQIAATLRNVMSFFGESSEEKIAAMMAIFADAPGGDVVEIGVLTGRSASVLEMMARCHGTSAVLAIDPWSHATSVQRESPAELQRMVDVWDANVPFETFLLQLLPIARPGRFNYLRMTSAEAHPLYAAGRVLASAEFGEATYAGQIAVLHIDGNHDHSAVQEDTRLWLPHLRPGGWLILDDYVWMHGDGPQRVGDALLADRAAEISNAFVCGKALFIKFGAA
jgi:predicted O-methyltransferase YrrM